MHAIIAFGSDTPLPLIAQLVGGLVLPKPRRAAAASEVLRVIGNEAVVRELAGVGGGGRDWVVATLGRLPSTLVRQHLQGTELLAKVEPLLAAIEVASAVKA